MERKLYRIYELRINHFKKLAAEGKLTPIQNQEYKNLCDKASKLNSHIAKIELVNNEILKHLFELKLLKDNTKLFKHFLKNKQ
jgi:hypothetical protein